jgi:hypothetical protein
MENAAIRNADDRRPGRQSGSALANPASRRAFLLASRLQALVN